MPYADPAARRARYHQRKAEDEGYLARVNEYHRQWRAAHPERAAVAARASTAAYRNRHPERISEYKARPESRRKEAEGMARRRAADLERYREMRLRDYHNDPDASTKSRARAHGMTLADYQARVAEQDGKCAICRREETARGSTGRIRRLGIDHDHTTGEVRGLLCHACNVALGLLNDDPELLEAAAGYLRSAARRRVRLVAKAGD